MGEVDKIHAWKQTKTGLIVVGIAALSFAYIFASKAIDTGSYWHYLLAIIFTVLTVRSFVRAFKRHGKK